MQQRSAALKVTKYELIAFANSALKDNYEVSHSPRRKPYSDEIEMMGFFHFHDNLLRRNNLTVGFFVEDSISRTLPHDMLYGKDRFDNYLMQCASDSIFTLYSFFYFNLSENHRHVTTASGESIESIVHPLSGISSKLGTLMVLTLTAFDISDHYSGNGLSANSPFLVPSVDFSENLKRARRFFDTIVRKTHDKMMGAELLAVLVGRLPDAQQIINLIDLTERNSHHKVTNDRNREEIMRQIKSTESYLKAIKLQSDIYALLTSDPELTEAVSLIANSDFPSKHDSFPGLSRQK